MDKLAFHPVYGHSMRPGLRIPQRDGDGESVFRTNSLGFRGAEWPARRPGTSRLVVLGDSFVNAWGVPEQDMLAAAAARALSEATGAAWEGIALAADDWGTAQELLALRAHGERLRPDVVALAVYAGNDLANNGPGLAGLTAVSASDPVRPYLVPGPGATLLPWSQDPLRAALRRRSRLVRVLERAWLARRPPALAAAWAEARAGRLPPFRHWEIYERELRPEWLEAWDITEALVRALRDECTRLGARLVIVELPAVQEVVLDAHLARFERAWQRAAGRGDPLDSTLDWNAPSIRLSELGGRAAVRVLDLLPRLRQEVAARGRSVYAQDGHFDRTGSRLAGELLGAFLADRLPPATGAAPEHPVDLLPRAPAWLDVRESPPAAFLGEGWGEWSRGGLPIAETTANAFLARPPDGAAVVVEGQVPARTPKGLQLHVALDGAHAGRFALPASGPFALASGAVPPPAPGRCVEVSVSVTDAQGMLLASSGVRLARLRFAPPAGLQREPPRSASSAAPRAAGSRSSGRP